MLGLTTDGSAEDVTSVHKVQPREAPRAPTSGRLSAATQLGIDPQNVSLLNIDCVEGMAALADASVDLVIADPPYNIGVLNSEWDKVPEYMAWSKTWLAQAVRVLKPGGSLFLWGSPAKLWIARLKLMAADDCGLTFMQHISWCYKQGGDSRLKGMSTYSVRLEQLEWFVKPGATTMHTFNAHEAVEHYSPEDFRQALAKGVGRVTEESLRQGRPPRNWWEIPRVNSKSKERQLGSHPSMKPLELCERIVKVHSNPGDVVCIPFGGSGSECVAAAKAGRKVAAFEIDPKYHRIGLRRLVHHGIYPPELAPPIEEGDLDRAQPTSDGTDVGLLRDRRNSSGYKGVFRHGNKFVVKKRVDGRLENFGTFTNAIAAAEHYKAMIGASGAQDCQPAVAAAVATSAEVIDFASCEAEPVSTESSEPPPIDFNILPNDENVPPAERTARVAAAVAAGAPSSKKRRRRVKNDVAGW